MAATAPTLEAGSPASRRRFSPAIAIPLGVAINVAGFAFYEGPGRAENLSEYIAKVGNAVRSDAAGTLLSSVPGYLLFFFGIAVLLRRRQETQLLGTLSQAIIVIAVAAAVLDLFRATVVLLAAGTQDLESADFVMTAPQLLTDAWYLVFRIGLAAFLLNLVLCLVALVVLAVQDGQPQSSGPRTRWWNRVRPAVAIPLGAVMYLIGLMGWSFSGGRPSGLVEYADQVGNLLRRDALVTFVFSVPGYLLFFGGIAVLLSRRRQTSRLLGFVAWALFAVAVATAVADALVIVVGLVSVGTQDLNSPDFVISTPQWFTDIWSASFNMAGIGQTIGVGLCLAGLIANALVQPKAASASAG